MSVSTHETTIREYVKSHTKDDIAFFLGDQFEKKDAEIDMLRKALGTAGERINAQDAEIEELKLTIYEAIGHITRADLLYITMGATRLGVFMAKERNEHA